MIELLLEDGRDTKTSSTGDALGNRIGEEMTVEAVSIAVLVENTLEHRLESLLEELLDQDGLKLLAHRSGLLLLAHVLGMSHLHEHGRVHAHVLLSYAIGFHCLGQLMMSSA